MTINALKTFLQEHFPEYSGYSIEYAKRPSRNNFGRFFPKENRIVIHDKSSATTYRTEDEIKRTAIHELAHFVQYSQGYRRIKGIMHNQEFVNIFKNLLLRVYDEDYVNQHITSRFKKPRKIR